MFDLRWSGNNLCKSVDKKMVGKVFSFGGCK